VEQFLPKYICFCLAEQKQNKDMPKKFLEGDIEISKTPHIKDIIEGKNTIKREVLQQARWPKQQGPSGPFVTLPFVLDQSLCK